MRQASDLLEYFQKTSFYLLGKLTKFKTLAIEYSSKYIYEVKVAE